MAIQQGFVVRRHGRDFRGKFFELDLGVGQPLPVGRFLRQFRLDFRIINDASLFHVDEEHLARLEAPLLDDLMFRNGEHAHFGSHDDMVVIGDQVSGWPQTVSIEGCTNLFSIREGHSGRAIPRFH